MIRGLGATRVLLARILKLLIIFEKVLVQNGLKVVQNGLKLYKMVQNGFFLFLFFFFVCLSKMEVTCQMIDMMGLSYDPGCNYGLCTHACVKFEA